MNQARRKGTNTSTLDASWQSMRQSVRINFCRTSRGMSDRWGAFHSSTPDISRIIELGYKPPSHIFQISKRTRNTCSLACSTKYKTRTRSKCVYLDIRNQTSTLAIQIRSCWNCTIRCKQWYNIKETKSGP